MKRIAGVSALLLLLAAPAAAQEQSFPSGSLIVPMDIDHQDTGMLRAFGLVYQLLLSDVPVAWCIQPGKSLYVSSTRNPTNPGNSVDFTATAKDVRTGASVGAHGYRGGPFVVDAAHRTQALAVVGAWNAGQANVVNVHEATESFTATVSRLLINAPNIAINADGNEPIAYGYLNAAGIPDSIGNTWNGTSPDVMTPEEIAGPTTTNQRDGRLWGPTGLPRYCQLMSMHWSVSRDAISNESIAEMREYLLNYPVHLFAECQAVNQLEDAPAGHFVSTDNGTGTPTKSLTCGTTTTPNNGLCAKKPTPALPLEFLNSDLPFAQLDGPFKTVGGSEPAYGLAPGSAYYDDGIVMIREQNAAGGVNGKADLWMTGYANFAGGVCEIGEGQQRCARRGKVSYLGGHQYELKVPISANGATQGTRLFLNSLFEAACVTVDGNPDLIVIARAPDTTSVPLVTFTVDWWNDGPGVAVAASLIDTLPVGAAFVSATNGGVFSAGKVTWALGDLGVGAFGSVSVTVALPGYGSYDNSGKVTFKVGNNVRTAFSNTTTTVYAAAPPDAGTQSDGGTGGAGGGLCTGVTCPGPLPANPCLVGACNPATGSCGLANVADGVPCDDGNACTVGTTCVAGSCAGGTSLQCTPPANPCQTASCVVSSGCVVSNVANGTTCSSGSQCVVGETCVNGTCGGGASRVCAAPLSPCQVATCNPATGCGSAPGNEGVSCDDGDVCTSGTTCGSGLCQGGTGCPAPSAPCTLVLCGATGCDTVNAAAGTDPGGDCPAVGSCTRSCDGAGRCTTCGGGSGGGGGGGVGAGGAGGATSGGAGGAGGGGGRGGSSGSGGGATDGGSAPDGGGAGTSGAGGSGARSGSGGSVSGTGGGGGSDGGVAGGGTDAGVDTQPGGGGTEASGCGCSVNPVAGGPSALAMVLLLALGWARRRRPGARG
jgi:uncharacterized repeat protein (TIGR01451 family)